MSGKLELIGTVASPGAAAPPPIHPAMLRTRSPVARALIAMHALAPDQAAPFQARTGDAPELARLQSAGIVRETIAGYYWLDLVANFHREQRLARGRAMWAVGLSALIVVAAILFYRG